MTKPFAVLAAIVFGILCFSFVSTAADLKTYQGIYAKNLNDINLQYGVKAGALAEDYIAALKRIREIAQREGDLEKTKSALAEIERFTNAKVVNESDAKNSHVDIKPAQLSYIQEVSALALTRARNIVTLSDKYDKALAALQIQLTKEGNLDDATKVRDERTALTEIKELKSAKSLILAYTRKIETSVSGDKQNVYTKDQERGLHKIELTPINRIGASFRMVSGKVKPLKQGCTLYSDWSHTLKERPKRLPLMSYVMAPFSGCSVVCEKEGIAFALGLFDEANQQQQTQKVRDYLAREGWAQLEDVPQFILFYYSGADRIGRVYWKEIKKGDELTFPNGTILCFKNR